MFSDLEIALKLFLPRTKNAAFIGHDASIEETVYEDCVSPEQGRQPPQDTFYWTADGFRDLQEAPREAEYQC